MKRLKGILDTLAGDGGQGGEPHAQLGMPAPVSVRQFGSGNGRQSQLIPLVLGLGFALVCLHVRYASAAATNAEAEVRVAAAAAAPAPAPAPALVVKPSTPPATGAPPAAAVPVANAPARNIRFQFDGMQYMDVLERFAQMAGKPLVADTNIQGTLTFNDPKTYNYSEALDTLNLMLSMKGVTLMESGHYLQLVPFKQLPQMPLKIMRGVDQTGDIRPGEIVTVVLEVQNLDAKELAESVTAMLSSAGSVAALSKGRGLMVTDRLSNIQRIRYLLSQIDTAPVGDRQMKTYTLLHASGAIVSDLINRTFGVSTAPKRTQFNPTTKQLDVLPADPNDYVTSVYDDASRTLVLFGPRDRINLAEEMVNKFEQKDGGAGDVRIYYPQSIKPEELATMIRQAVSGIAAPGETAAAAATKARLIVDTPQNRLIVAAPIPGQLDAIENFIMQVDKGTQGAKGTGGATPIRSTTVQLTRVFRPRAADATNVAQILTQALTRRSPSGQASTTASVSYEPNSQSVIVSGAPGDIQIAQDLVTQLETGSVTPMPQQTRFIDVGGPAEAKRLQPLIEQLYRNQVSDGSSLQTAHAKILADPDSGRLIVTASEEHLAKIEALVKQMRGDRQQAQPRRLQIIPLKNARIDTALKGITDLVNEKMKDRRFQDQTVPLLVPDTTNNRLLVTAGDDQIKEIEQIVTAFDVVPDKARREMAVIPLQSKSANEIIPMITQLMGQLGEDQTNPLLVPKLVADPTGKQIIALAAPKDLEKIRALAQQLDTVVAPTAARQSKAVDLHSRTAAELVPLVTQLYTEQTRGQAEPAGGAATLIAEARNNRIIISGPQQEITRVEAIIRQFDPATPPAVRQFKGVELYSRNATELAPLVTQLYQEQLKGQPEPAGGPATLIPETKNNRVMVSGSEKEIARVESIIRQLDPESKKSQKEETRIIRLKAASANDIVGIIEKSLNAQSQQVKVLVDQRSNSLVVTGEPGVVESAGQLIQELDTKSTLQPREMRLIELKHGEAATLTPMLNTLFAEMVKDQRGADYQPQTKIVPDTTANRVIVTGPKDELNQIAALVEQLDAVPEQSEGARVFKLNSADAPVLASVISNAMTRYDTYGRPVHRISVAADEKSNSLVVSGTRQDLQDASVMIEQLDGQAVTAKGRTLKIMDVKAEDAEALASLALKIFTEQNQGRNIANQITITAEPSGKRLIVLAPNTLMEQIETVITSLDSKPDQVSRELHTVELKNAVATDLLPTVSKIYAEQNQGKLLKPATIYPDSSGSRFMIYGTKEQANAIRQIVETVESQKRAPRETKIIDLGRLAEATRVLPLAQQLYRDQLASNPLAGPPDAQMVTDGRTGRIIVSARQDQMKVIEDIYARLQVGSLTNQAPRETRAFEVGTPADVQRLLPLVQQLYQDQWKDRSEADPADAQIMADPKAGRIIATGKPDHLKQIDAILKQLGAAVPAGTNAPAGKVTVDPRETRVLDLSTANAVELATTVRTLYLDEAKGRLGTLVPDTLIVPDAGANRLILVGETTELAVIEDIIRKLDKVSAQSASARVFKLKSADPAKLTEILTSALVRYDAYGRPQKRVSISVDPKSRTLIATGDPKELQGVSVIIEQLDTTLGERPERKMKVVTLKQGRVLDIASKTRQLYNDRITSQPELGTTDTLILEDLASNQIILAGSEEQIKLLEGIIGDLQAAAPAQGARETRMIEIGQAEEMQRLLPLVQQLYQERMRSRDASDSADAQILADAKSARFIVTARTNHIAEIESIVKELRATDLNQPRDTRIYDLSTASAVELSTTVRSLYQDQSKNRPGAQTMDTSILPDVSANRLIVTGSSNELAIVEDIIKKLDKVSAQSGTVRVFKLKSADPSKVMEILGNALTSYDSYGRPRRRVGVTVDAKTRTIIVAGDPKELQSLQNAAVIIEQLDSALGAQPDRKIKVVALKTLKAVETSSKVRQLYNDQLTAQPEIGTTEVLILEDTTSNQLILAGSEVQLKLLETIIGELQNAVVSQGARETKIFDLGQPEQVTRLQPLVLQLYQDQWKNKEAGDLPDAQIVADTNTSRLIVTGRTNHLEEIGSILARLTAPVTNAEPRDTRVYELQSTAAAELAATVKSLYQEQLKSRPAPAGAPATILPDLNANRLVVSGGTNDLALIDGIIQKIDKVEAQTGRTRVFKLKSAEAEQVATILSSALVQTTPYGRSIPRVSVGTDAQNNLLIVSGAPQDLQSVSVIIEQMDNIMTKEPRQMRVVALKAGLATEVSNRVKQLYQDQLKGRPKNGAADALILGDDVANRLIITASESHMKLIEEIVSKLQEAGEGAGRQTRVLQLQRGSATSMAAMIAQLFARQTSSDDPSQQLIVTAAGNDRALVIDAAGQTLEKVEQLVKNLDGEELKGAVEVRTYQLPEGNAMDLAQSLARLFAERAGPAKGGLEPRFEADPKANVLMVAATKDQFERIGKLVEELKQTAAVANEIRTFVLKHGEPDQIANVLEDMLSENGGGAAVGGGQRRGRWRPGVGFVPASDSRTVRVSPASSLNAVVVQGPPEKLTLAEKLIQTLDKSDLDGQSVIQTVHLKKAHAEDLATAVTKTIAGKGAQSRVQRVSVTPVENSNSLLLNGPSDAVQEVLKIIRELDQESQDDEIELRIFKLENGNAKEVSTIVNQLLMGVTRAQMRAGRGGRQVQPTVTVEDRSNSLIISATPAHFKVVEKLLTTLDKAPSKSERDVQFVWLRNAKADEVALKVKAVFEGRPEAERPVVESDIFANSITVISRRTDMSQIQDLITRLDETTKDTTVQVRLRPLDTVPAEQMARMLTNIYPQMVSGSIRLVEKLVPPKPEVKAPVSVPAGTNQPASTSAAPAVTPAAPKEEAKPLTEVVIAIDKAANSLLMSGPANELDQVDRIISELTYTFISNDAEFRLFPLKEADPIVVARTLTELFRPEQVRVEPQQRPPGQPGEVRTVIPAPKITVVSEPRTRAVIVRAKPTDFALFETLIKQLDVSGISAQLEFRLVPLTNAPPEKVMPLVQQMVTQMNLVRPGEPLTVTADARSRGLLLVARDSLLAQVEKMIRALDTPSIYAEAEVLVISLKKAGAPQLSLVLQSMLKPGEQGQVTPEARELQEQVRRLKIQNNQGQAVLLDLTKPIKVMADPVAGAALGGNRLILTSTPDNIKALAAVVAMMDTVPVLEGIDVKLVRLRFADAASVSQTLSTIFAQGIRLTTSRAGPGQPEGEAGKALARPLNVAVDQRSNTLILSGQSETLDLAMKVVEDLDQQLDRFVTEVRLFRLKHASATRLLPMLQAVFAEGPSVPGSEGLSAMVSRLRVTTDKDKPKTTEQPKLRAAMVMQADDLANILIVAARSDSLPLIEDVVNQLDIPAASGMDMIRIYPLNHADALTLQKIITDLHTGPRAAALRNEDKPNLTVDQRINALIVAGNGKSFGIIDSLIAQLDTKLPFELRDIHIIPLVNADAGEVAGTIQRLMDARITQRAAASKEVADSLKVIVLADPRSNSLLVGGSKDSFELVESLAQQLDGASPALSGRIRLVPLTYADARALTVSLNQLFAQRYSAARTADVARNRPVIVGDPRSNSLLVAAGVDDNATIDELLKKLDRKLDDPSMSVTVIPLKHNESSRIAASLEGLFLARRQNRTVPGVGPVPQDQVEIQTDSLNNALIVFASKENLEIINSLLAKLDVEPTAAGGVVEAFTLGFADAQRVASMLQSLIQQGMYRPGAPAGAARTASPREALAITVDPRSNTLIVSASPENLLVVKEIIKRVDTKDFAAAGNIKVYELKKARASSLAAVLEQFFRAKRAGEAVAINAPERSSPVAVIPDDRVNLLLVTGTKESFDVMDRLVQQLDGEDVFTRMNFRVFPLKRATATKLQPTLQQIVANRPQRVRGEPPDPITIVADSWVNALLVGASVEDLTLVSSLIEKLDAEPAEMGIAVQVFPLAKADSRRVAQTVQALFREGTPGTQMPVTVSADERMNAIIVSAGEADAKRIGELVRKLDTDQVAKVAEIKVFPLRYARADTLSTILNTALNTKPTPLTEQSPNTQSLLQFITRTEEGKELITAALKESVLITPDARMNSLIVSGPVDYMGLLEQIITRLDSSSPQLAKIKVFPLQNADARQMSELLVSLFRMQQAMGAANQRSVQYTLVRQGSDPESLTEEEQELASATLGTAEQNALTVTVDPRTNSLLVGGTEHYVDLVSQIIDSLDASPGHERKTEVYRLRNAQALEVATAIRTFLDQERMRVSQVLGSEAVGTAQRLLEREVAVVPEQVSNTLLISANPRYFDEVKKMIEELDLARPQVLIQVLLAEVTLEGLFELGVEGSFHGTKGDVDLGVGTDFAEAAEILKGGSGFSTLVTGSDFTVLLRALQSDGRLEVLSRPQIVTADNKPASINVGQRVPIITDSRLDVNNNLSSSYRYEDLGVTLYVTPRISSDGFVKMDVGTTNSVLSTSTVSVGTGKSTADLPIINQRRATTTVSVQSGQTIIIGGLIATVDDVLKKKVPFLGDIPVLGFLFRSTQRKTDRKELLILLTPQVLMSPTDAGVLTDAKTVTRDQLERSQIKTEIKRDELQKQLLDPLFPESQPHPQGPDPKAGDAPAVQPPAKQGNPKT